jgi:hypothetical protein
MAGDYQLPMTPDQIARIQSNAERLTGRKAAPMTPPTPTDENGCYTLPNGDCVSPGPCLHTTPTRAEIEAALRLADRHKVSVLEGSAWDYVDPITAAITLAAAYRVMEAQWTAQRDEKEHAWLELGASKTALAAERARADAAEAEKLHAIKHTTFLREQLFDERIRADALEGEVKRLKHLAEMWKNAAIGGNALNNNVAMLQGLADALLANGVRKTEMIRAAYTRAAIIEHAIKSDAALAKAPATDSALEAKANG